MQQSLIIHPGDPNTWHSRRARVTFAMAQAVLLGALIWAGVALFAGLVNLVLLALSVMATALGALILYRAHYYSSARLLLFFGAVSGIAAGAYLFPAHSDIGVMLIPASAFPFMVFSWRRRRTMILSLSVIPPLLWIGLSFAGPLRPAHELSSQQAQILSYVAHCTAFGVVMFEVGFFSRLVAGYAAALEAAVARAETASQAKSVFLSAISHDMRTPLTTVVGAAELLEMEARKVGFDTCVGQARRVHMAADDMLNMVDRALAFSEISDGALCTSCSTVNMRVMVQGLIDRMRISAAQKGVMLMADLPDDILVVADPVRLEMALRNLLDNAVRYSPRGGSVRVFSAVEDNMVRLTIVDQGQGFSADQARMAFEPFERLNHHNSAVTGLGVGLSIVKRYVEDMQGSVGIEPVEIAEGGHVWVQLQHAPHTDRTQEKTPA
ncbi:MAG: HAMP domain-containing sensor histidine kinase [Pseudomonadota bacterium]|jgi:signal transduction histidine kinase|nr:HAMP domain-containing sensor histidine kinase [Pseudomonadota bacterium]